MALESILKQMKFTKISLLSFFKHFINIAWAMHHIGKRSIALGRSGQLYYDVVEMFDGSTERLKVRSLVEAARKRTKTPKSFLSRYGDP
jgi:hypothetical protein